MAVTRNKSRKRDAILAKLRSTDSHPSAEWIYHKLKPEYPDLSLGTVYRNISLFREDGQVVSVGTVGGQERFDACTHPHAHFICSHCGAVLDVDAEIDENPLYSQIAENYGFSVESHKLSFSGVCKNCLRVGDDF